MTKAEQEWSLIEALVYCKGKRLTKKSCAGCPYAGAGCAIDATIAKLKAQEAVEPTTPDEDNIRYCGACGSPVGYEVLEAPGIEYVQYSYCPNCGQAVKWND